jgi:hypothetical protein
MSTVPDLTSIDAILSTPSTACNVSTTNTLIGLQQALNTAYCGPLLSTMDCKDKRVTNVADMTLLTTQDTPAETQSKLKQAVNYGSLNLITLRRDQRDGF